MLTLFRRAAVGACRGHSAALIGADLLNFGKIHGLGAVACIGVAGALYGVSRTGMAAFLIARIAPLPFTDPQPLPTHATDGELGFRTGMVPFGNDPLSITRRPYRLHRPDQKVERTRMLPPRQIKQPLATAEMKAFLRHRRPELTHRTRVACSYAPHFSSAEDMAAQIENVNLNTRNRRSIKEKIDSVHDSLTQIPKFRQNRKQCSALRVLVAKRANGESRY